MFRSLLVAAALAACVLPAAAETQSRVLANGMKVIVREDHRAPVAVTQLWFKVGSADEHAGKTGLSHALEHMMFKGTPTVPAGEFSRRISALGGNDNAFTSRNETVYHQEFAAANLPQVLELEADRMVNLNFSDADFENEMKVIREERRLTTDNDPGGKMWEQINLAAFSKPENRAPVIGYAPDLDALKPEDLRAWYRAWYAPHNATLVIVGDVKAGEVLDNVEKLFGSLPDHPLPARNDLNEPPAAANSSARATAPVSSPVVGLAVKVPALRRVDDKLPYALNMLANVLDGSMSARIERNLVRGSKVATEASLAYDLLSRAPDVLLFSGTPAPNVKPEQLTAAFWGEVRKVAEQGVGEEELARVRNRSLAAREFAKDSMETQASNLGSLESAGFSYQDEEEIRRRRLEVSAEEVREAARWLLAQKHATVVLYPEAK
ncbi:pitrilysin family protein [Eikenella sp. Marseille-P7795]|uniref:M16 family metallopeptidase n=1 Tax=Eikenella sp. Marseille-P7795 TaxID=2866577 RepID=UPI001CE3D76A|nr:insulinase family protein [Eikenella sp. Marseille-P7795]